MLGRCLAVAACTLALARGVAASSGTRGDFVEAHCVACHSGDEAKAGLRLDEVPDDLADPGAFALWVKVFDRVRAGEMPPRNRKPPEEEHRQAFLAELRGDLEAADAARVAREGRSRVRRMNRVEFENTLRDLLGLPGLRLLGDLPADGKSRGFDRAADALDFSFVHMESYLAAIDHALNEATPAFAERPPTFKYRYRPWDATRHGGSEVEGAVALNVGQKNFVPLVGLDRDPTFEAVGYYRMKDDPPHATALGFFRHEDADFRFSLTAIAPVLTGRHKVRVSAYSFAWDGEKPVPTDRAGAVGLAIHSTGEHFGTRGVPANRAGVAEFDVWLRRADEHIHGVDNDLRLVLSSCEKVRDFPHDEGVKGPPRPCPGLAIEWIEIEGPIHDRWPPASQEALFGELPVKEWTEGSGPRPVRQTWPRGKHGAMPEDIYGEDGTRRPVVQFVSADPDGDASRLLRVFLARAFRRPATDEDLATYRAIFADRRKAGDHFQDALKAAYRAALASPNFLLIGARDDAFALAERLSYFLWAGPPDEALRARAEAGRLAEPSAVRAEAERMLKDPRAARFVESFTGQWLRLREIDGNAPDKQLYPEFMPWLQESMVAETRAYFAELIAGDLGVSRFVKSDFATLNEPLARHYGIPGVSGFAIRRVPLPEGSPRGGLLTQGAVLKVTANGTTTSPVPRGAFVMEKILGIVPTPAPADAGSIEPDTRGATTIREQLEKHKRNATCAGCHVKMDPYGFALEGFDVVGAARDRYRARGGEGRDEDKPVVHGRPIEYHEANPVDSSGELPDGRAFRDVVELRDMLAADEEALARAFVGHLATYATGAPIGFADRAEVERILDRSKGSKYGVRTLLLETVASPLFLRK